MTEGQSSLSNQLFNNRQLFIRYNRFKLDRINEILAFSDRRIFTLIPRLLHSNQEGMPGYVEGDVPQGIFNYVLTPEIHFTAEDIFPDVIIRRNNFDKPFIETVLLMGSIGSIAHTQKSDLDYTLLVRKNSVSPEQLALFNQKLKKIETWVWENYKLEIHFFVNDIDEVKQNIFGESDSESTGSALAKLLKEEMYRTLVIIAGKIPYWWIMPLETDDKQYEQYCDMIRKHHTLLNPDEFVDIGNVEDIAEDEFFGGTIWALIKSFKAPFKTLIKMGLLEDYMFSETRFNLLCHEIKKKVFHHVPFEQIDPYLSLFFRSEKYFEDTKGFNELDALRTAFYIKVGTQVTGDDLDRRIKDPKKRTLVELIKRWDWPSSRLDQLNKYIQWPMMQKVALGDRINKILMSSYRIISERNKTLGNENSLITERDTHLLGRKLFSFFNKSNYKVESLFALIDGETGEKELTFLFHQVNPRDKGEWYLIRGRSKAFLEQIPKENIIKKAPSLLFLVAFSCFNSLYRRDTALLLRSDQHQSIKELDLRNILQDLSSYLAQVDVANIPNECLLSDAHIEQLFLVVDFGNPIPAEVMKGSLKECQTTEKYADFINQRIGRLRAVTAIYLTSWGELFCKTFAGLNCMHRVMVELGPQVIGTEADKEDFLKVFIPGNRRDVMSLSWLNNYILKSLRVRTRDSSTVKVAES